MIFSDGLSTIVQRAMQTTILHPAFLEKATRKLPLPVLLSISLIGIVLLLIFSGVAVYQSQTKIYEQRKWVTYTYQILLQNKTLLNLLQDAETGQRGFIITGNLDYLAPYTNAIKQVEPVINSLQQLTINNEIQQKRILILRSLIKEKLSELGETIKLRRQGNFAAATTLVANNSGKIFMDRIRSVISSMDQEEHTLLNMRIHTLEVETIAANHKIILLATSAIVLLILTAGFSLWLLNKKQQYEIERNKATELLARSEEQLHLLVEGITDSAILMLDPTGHILTWNSGATRIKGYSQEEIIGKHFSIFYTKEDLDNGKPASELAIATAEGHYQEEGWRVRKDGSLFWTNVSITALWDKDNKLKGFSKIARDLTERKRFEESLLKANLELEERTAQLKVANTDLESFSYSVSHDLRAPLRAINGFVSILLEDFQDKLEPVAREHLDVISRNAIKMGQLIDDLLAFSRTTRHELTHSKINMEELMGAVFNEQKELCPGRVLELHMKSVPDGFGDRSMIAQVITNLVSNAIKFTRHQTTAEIELGGHVQDHECIYYVKDNGLGFDMRFVDKLFKPFQKLHRPKDFEGTGIGLALVQRIIHKHGGKVWAEGKLDVGTTVYFTLPTQGGFNEWS